MSDEIDYTIQQKLELIVPPEEVGHYKINGSLCICFSTKPNWWYRLWAKVFFGWVWENYKTTEEQGDE